MIRLCLVEDQALVRQGIRSLLRLVPEVEVVAEAVDGEEAVEMICREHPDAVLLDLRLPKLSGLEVLEELSRRDALVPTVALTTFDDEALMIETVRAGARGFLLKDVSLEELSRAIRTVAAGGTYLQPAVTQGVQRRFANLEVDVGGLDPADALTDREVEVLRLIAGGLSNREIAESLAVAEGTAKNHISSILSKLGVRDRTRAVLKGLDMGLL
ncbi:MAG: response regulator transcription factor [Deltaproteobacteria bacterium]|nr:response regulator transcription factor [Deltaproteobacteria bacterium]